jgi:PIN domain nuclease of toxin-antitoxin system
MTVYVLDSSALIRFLDREAGFHRVKSVLRDCVEGRVAARISAIQWGEVAGNLRKRFGASRQAHILSALLSSDIAVSPVTRQCAVRAAEIRADRKLSYADAFALDLAMDSPDCVLLTADYGFKAVEDLARIEFLPAK